VTDEPGTTREVRVLGVIGAGVIGAGWVCRALSHGLDVVAWDPSPGWGDRLTRSVENAWPACENLGLYPGSSPARLRCADTLEAVCLEADFIQENAPERETLKQELHQRIDAVTPHEVVVASSSSGLLPSRLQSRCRHPGRLVIGHPFNPVYLLPLVEVLGGNDTAQESLDSACGFYASMGMYPLRVRKEIEGYLSDRLQEALWREALHLVNDGVATTEELDAAIAYGPGLRWALMGTNMIFHMAGGDGGMRHMLQQFGPALQLPWTRLVAPELTDELIERMARGTEQQASGRSVKELEQVRDAGLIGILRALGLLRVGAGEVIRQDEDRRLAQVFKVSQGSEDRPSVVVRGTHPLGTQALAHGRIKPLACLAICEAATRELWKRIGIEACSPVQTEMTSFAAVESGHAVTVESEVVDFDESQTRIAHRFTNANGDLVCEVAQTVVDFIDEEGNSGAASGRVLDAIRRSGTKAAAKDS
jgi:carnitine 3-dehydrogenase